MIRELLEKYDGVVLVHPSHAKVMDVGEEQLVRIFQNFREAQRLCLEMDKPLVIAGEFDLGYFMDVIRLGYQYYPIPDFRGKNGPEIMNKLYWALGEQLEEHKMLFGGFRSNVCVAAWMRTLCSTVGYAGQTIEVPFSESHTRREITSRFNYGLMVDELTDRIDMS
jgi:hypothetical protein